MDDGDCFRMDKVQAIIGTTEAGLPPEGSAIVFDLLCEWASSSFRREVREAEPKGSPWAALALALRFAGALPLEEASERALRVRLVDLYSRQSPEVIGAIITAKIALGGDFARLAGAGGPERARARWPWYLYCLTFAANEPTDACVVRFGLDSVDLRVLSWQLDAAVTILQLTGPNVHFEPTAGAARHTVRLAQHGGRWAALLGAKPPPGEAMHLEGRIVQLASGLFVGEGREAAPLEMHRGYVQKYSAAEDVYMVSLGEQQVAVDREHILRVLYHPGSGVPQERSVLDGVPDGSLEWMLLLNFVRQQAAVRIEELKKQLGGRDPRRALGNPEPADASGAANDAASDLGSAVGRRPPSGSEQAARPPSERPPQAGAATSLPRAKKAAVRQGIVQGRLPWERLVNDVEEGSDRFVRAVAAFRPADGEAGQLPLLPGDELRVRRVAHRWALVERCEPAPSPQARHRQGWCPCDCLTVWEAGRPFRPTGLQDPHSQLLVLDPGERVVLVERCRGEWQGYAHAQRWSTRCGSGVVPMCHLRPFVYLSRRKAAS